MPYLFLRKEGKGKAEAELSVMIWTKLFASGGEGRKVWEGLTAPGLEGGGLSCLCLRHCPMALTPQLQLSEDPLVVSSDPGLRSRRDGGHRRGSPSVESQCPVHRLEVSAELWVLC